MVENVLSKEGIDLYKCNNPAKVIQFSLVRDECLLKGQLALAIIVVVVYGMMTKVILVHIFIIINLDKASPYILLLFCLGEGCQPCVDNN